MLTEQKLQNLKSIIQQSSRDEIIWMSGYLAGLSDKKVDDVLPPVKVETQPVEKLVISVLYGTETGNSKKISSKLAAALKAKQHKVTVTALDQYNVANLAKEKNVLIIMSTHGDGEPPLAAKKFYDYLHAKQLDLNHLNYAVLALGDSSYPLFCKAGEDVDARLSLSGAKQILALEKVDADFYPASETWINNVLDGLQNLSNEAIIVQKPVPKTGKQFYKGVVKAHINLNDKGSSKETWHVEIQTKEGIYYLPGDSLGIVPINTDDEVNEILNLLKVYNAKKVNYKNEEISLFDLFKYKLNVLYLPLRIVEKYAALVQTELPSVRLDLKNLLALYPISQNVSLDSLIAILEPITPRLYSISSSPSAHGNSEIHVTVGRNKFLVNEKTKYGFCSSHFAGLNENDEVLFYIHPNNNFRLPQHEKDIIMIGPGTGIAPFRSFLSHRDNEGASGRNWLFFGDQHFHTDFLYQSELLSFFDTGFLTKINTAFSRDQKEKLYVQHRMLQQSRELIKWIENGAYIYVCGCKDRMARDVENALISIISKEKNLDETEATEYLNYLEEQGRYAKDVY